MQFRYVLSLFFNYHSNSQETNVQSNAKKRGRPTTKSDVRSWTDEETATLIEIWEQHDNLYNTRHKNYFNRDLRQKTLAAIEDNLKGLGITASVKQISKKLTDLKNYYGAQKRMTESSKTSGAGSDDVYISPWKFFDSLHFLSDAFTPRSTTSNAEEFSTYDATNPPSAKSKKKIADQQNEGIQKAMSSAAAALEEIASKRAKKLDENKGDNAFCQFLSNQLSEIPECDIKDELKINIQQLVLQCKRQVKTSFATQHYSFPQHTSANVSRFNSPQLGSP